MLKQYQRRLFGQKKALLKAGPTQLLRISRQAVFI